MNSSDVKISDILEEVAAKYEAFRSFDYSCDAIRWSLYLKGLEETKVEKDIFEGLKNMGLNISSTRVFADVEDKQKARMIWLTWAAMMAREQGL